MAKQILSPVPIGNGVQQDNPFAFLDEGSGDYSVPPQMLAGQNPPISNPTDVASVPPTAPDTTIPAPALSKAATPAKRSIIEDPETTALREEALRNSQAFKQANAGINDYQRLLALQAGKPVQADLTSLISLGNSLSGNDVKYNAPKSQDMLAQLQTLQKDKQEAYKEYLAGLKSQVVGQQGAGLTGMANARMAALVARSGEDFDKDKILTQTHQTLNSLNRASGLLNGTVKLNPSNWALAQNDFINAMTNSNAATEGKINREMIHTWADDIAQIVQKGGTIQDLRKKIPDVVQQLNDSINLVRGEYQNVGKSRARELALNWAQIEDPRIQNTVASKISSLDKKFSSSPEDHQKTADIETLKGVLKDPKSSPQDKSDAQALLIQIGGR